jgi:dipeptidyl aminopeptidase/acylaminoacyl peptidase
VPTAAFVAPPPPAEEPRVDEHLIRRDLLFGNPEHEAPQLSPDGKYLAFEQPIDGVLNVVVARVKEPLDLSTAQPVTFEKVRPVSQFVWTELPGKLVFRQDAGGDENFHLYLADVNAVDGKNGKDLTPYRGARADLAGPISPRHPDEIVVRINDRDPKFADLYRVSLKTGERTLLEKNDRGYSGYEVDRDHRARLAYRPDKDGSVTALVPGADKTSFDTPLFVVPFEDSETTHALGFDDTGRTLYLADSRHRDTAALVALDLAAETSTVLAEDPRADMDLGLAHPRTGKPLLASLEYDREHHVVLDRSVQADEDFLRTVVPDADFSWQSCSTSFQRCVVRFTLPDKPTRYYLYDRAKKNAALLFSTRPPLDKLTLAKTTAAILEARDGLPLVSYLTLPVGTDRGDGKPAHPLPMVLLVHGGPWARADWGFGRYSQWLANRGYAVLQVNFRGSTGFGKKFVNAGNLEWGGKMHDDLLDAVHWATSSGIADPDKVAIYGGSYGGYAALAGATFTPDVFACAVDRFGPANLITLLASIPPYWEAGREQFYRRMGDPRTEEGKARLLSRSPVTHVGAIKRPLLITQGQNDPRVKPAESEQIVEGMKHKQIPVTYAVFSDEGHGFARPQNNLAALAIEETFLAQFLGGSYEPIGTSFQGSTIAVPTGAAQVYGLEESLKAKRTP